MTQPSDSATIPPADLPPRTARAAPPRPAPARPAPAPPPPVSEELEEEEEDEVEEEEEVDEDDDASDESEEAPRAPLRIGPQLRSAGSVLTSLTVHLLLLVSLGMWMVPTIAPVKVREIVSTFVPETPPEEELKVDLDERSDPQTEVTTASSAFVPQVGVAGGSGAVGGAAGAGLTTISAPQYDATVTDSAMTTDFSVDAPLDGAPPGKAMVAAVPDGLLGDPRAIVDNYQEAMDQITQEILWFMDKGNVLVVWCFDQSESMKDDQKEIRDKIERVYTELGLSSHQSDRLMTGVVSFGGPKVVDGVEVKSAFALHTQSPTSDRYKIRAAIDAVPIDPGGQEMMCEAVGRSIAHHREYAKRTGRQMLLVLVTDESGDVDNNNNYLEQAIAEAKAAKCRCYILGREAVFGYPYAYISWQHPQTKHVHWLQIDRGPETGFVEQLQTDGFHRRYDAHPSGFGPYEQTRLARETGGVFFMLPSLESNLVRGEKRRYELEAMRSYRPDLRARIEVLLDRDKSILRAAVWKTIYDLNPYRPDISKIIEMRVEFSPDFPTFVQQARLEQTKAIIYLEYLGRMQKVVEALAEHRRQESSPRWQANYDLLYAQLIAYQARMYEYGAYLQEFINKPKIVPLKKEPNLTLDSWDIHTRQETITKEKSEPYIVKATALYQAILRDHPGTPWAARAEVELKRGFGVQLHEDYHAPYPVIPPGVKLVPIPKL
jgi:hypothetical protein